MKIEVVSLNRFSEVMGIIERERKIATDTETFGLRWFDQHELFSFIVGLENHSFYFNFLVYDDVCSEFVLPRKYLYFLCRLFEDPTKTIYVANEKFELGMLGREMEIDVKATVWDVLSHERLLHNDFPGWYSLENISPKYGTVKDDAVEEYISKHRLYTKTVIPGKKKVWKDKHFDKVPFYLMSRYGCQDTTATRVIGIEQEKKLKTLQLETGASVRPTLYPLDEMERRLTPHVYNIMKRGILIDEPFCERKAKEHELECARAAVDFKEQTGVEFVDSNKVLKEAFDNIGASYPLTAKGNPSFKADVLKDMDNDLAKIVTRFRVNEKMAGTYYRSFLWHKTPRGRIHCNLNQDTTRTGRFSSSDPNLQNIPKKTDPEVRKAFLADNGHILFAIDYEQMEFRMMLDYAGQLDLIEMIKSGYDAHDATAELSGLTRNAAKTLNFALLYGVGVPKLAGMLGVTKDEAAEFKRQYFRKLPKVDQFLKRVVRTARRRKFIKSWAGRVLRFPDREFCYKAPNGLIQGGCADVVKYAMCEIGARVESSDFTMRLQVHDEIVFMCKPEAIDKVYEAKAVMESIYPYKNLPLTCSVDHSYTSWGEAIEGFPNETTRNEVQGAG